MRCLLGGVGSNPTADTPAVACRGSGRGIYCSLRTGAVLHFILTTNLHSLQLSLSNILPRDSSVVTVVSCYPSLLSLSLLDSSVLLTGPYWYIHLHLTWREKKTTYSNCVYLWRGVQSAGGVGATSASGTGCARPLQTVNYMLLAVPLFHHAVIQSQSYSMGEGYY